MNVALRLKVRNLYLVQDLTHPEIAERTGLSLSAIRSYVSRAGLTKVKREHEAKALQVHDARAREGLDEISAAIASEAEEIALGGLDRARKAVGSRSDDAAKDFQAWTGGVRNLAQVAKLSRGDGQVTPNGSITLNLFAVAGAKEAKPVDAAAVDVSAKDIQ
jgi:predicted DNA-binding protein YlxM (UPF0122 family)